MTAPGYVPLAGDHEGTVDVPKSKPFKHVFRLTRGGEVKVVFKGLVTAKSLRAVSVRAERVGQGLRWHTHSMTVEGSMARMDGLPVGEYAIEIDAGLNYETVSDTYFNVEAGRTVEVEIVVVPRDKEADDWVDVRGTVSFHTAWGEVESSVTLTGDEPWNEKIKESVELERVSAGTPRSFSLGRLPAGSYIAEVAPQWREKIEVTTDGGSFDFEIPEPATLLVRVVDEETGKPITDASVHWFANRVSSISGMNAATYAKSGAKPGEFRILTVPGECQVTASAPRAVDVTMEIPGTEWKPGPPALVAGKTTVLEMRLPPAGSVAVNFRCNGRPVAAPDIEAEVERPYKPTGNVIRGAAISPLGSTIWHMSGSGPRRVRDGLPAETLRLRIHDASRLYKPVPEREVRIKAGKTEEVIIDLIPVD